MDGIYRNVTEGYTESPVERSSCRHLESTEYTALHVGVGQKSNKLLIIPTREIHQ